MDTSPSHLHVSILVSTLLGRLTTRFWNMAEKICADSAAWALVRSGPDIGQEEVAYQFKQKVFSGVKVVCRPLQVLPHQSWHTISL